MNRKNTIIAKAQRAFDSLPPRAGWAVHNLFGHPAMEVCRLAGFPEIGEAIHDRTVVMGE